MLKITSEKNSDSVRFKLEGRLTGAWAHELEHEWHTIRQSGTGPLVVDLTGVTFVGEDGKMLLRRMWQEGAQLIATGCCTGHLVEEIMHSRPDVSTTR
jgi:anti-anti-sigma regulatory factor